LFFSPPSLFRRVRVYHTISELFFLV